MKKQFFILTFMLTLLVSKMTNAQLILNEIMVNPNGGSLPAAEYIELYNNSNIALSLHEYQLGINNITVDLPQQFLAPQQYLTLLPSEALNSFSQFGNVVTLNRWYPLNNTGATLRITKNGDTIDEISYTDSWYKENSKKSGGWSLERINPNWNCSHIDNWRASQAPLGGTPSRPNSILNWNHIPKLIFEINHIENTEVQLSLKNYETYQIKISTEKIILEPKHHEVEEISIHTNNISIRFKTPIEINKKYTLKILPIEICGIKTEETKLDFFKSTPVAYNDVLINEILFQPKDGGHDFVEIYNKTNHQINLQNWRLGNSIISNELLILPPYEYLAISTDINNLIFHYPNASKQTLYQISSLPAYPNNQGYVKLYDAQNFLIDSLHYRLDMHSPFLTNTKGISLERQDHNLPTNAVSNFRSAASTVGGATPGYKNSQQIEENRKKNNFFLTTKSVVINPNFGSQFFELNYELLQPNTMANIHIFRDDGTLVKRLISNQSLAWSGKIEWNGLDDYGQKVPAGHYIYWAEIYHENGVKMTFKEAFIVL